MSQSGTQTPGSFGWGRGWLLENNGQNQVQVLKAPSALVQNPAGFKRGMSGVVTQQCGLLLPCPGQQNPKWESEKHVISPSIETLFRLQERQETLGHQQSHEGGSLRSFRKPKPEEHILSINELITDASKTETANLSLQQGMKLQQSLTEGVFDGTSLEQGNKGSFDATRLN